MRKFEYIGPPILTRGEYGENVQFGHETPDAPGCISVWDSTFGWSVWISIRQGLESGGWSEIDYKS